MKEVENSKYVWAALVWAFQYARVNPEAKLEHLLAAFERVENLEGAAKSAEKWLEENEA